jgi:hypothetical protein
MSTYNNEQKSGSWVHKEISRMHYEFLVNKYVRYSQKNIIPFDVVYKIYTILNT